MINDATLLTEEEEIENIICGMDRPLYCGKIISLKEKHIVEILNYEDIIKNIERNRDSYKNKFIDMMNVVINIIEPPVLISNIFKSHLEKIEEIKHIYYFVNDTIVSFQVYLEKENWEVEEEIYNIYGNMLIQFPDKEIELKISRLWGRSPETMIAEGYLKW